MSDDERRDILRQVAAGTLAPEEAIERLGDTGGERAADPELPGQAVRRVRVTATAAAVRVTGDPSVREVVVEGRHRLRRDGDGLLVDLAPDDGEGDGDDDGGVMRVVVGRRTRFVGRPRRLTTPAARLRVNPALALELSLHASSASVDGVHGPVSGEVNAGHLRVEGFRSPLDLEVNAGALSATGTLTDGDSRIACDAGRVRVRLERGSSVRLEAHVNLGRLQMHVPGPPDGDGRLMVGEGRGRLVVEGNLANVEVDAR